MEIKTMAKSGEINYLKNLGPAGIQHSMNKPFSAVGCHRMLTEIGAIFTILPPPPARIIDIGCGTGWTSFFFAKRGYNVTGVDIAPDMIEYANQIKQREQIDDRLLFHVCDYENMQYKDEFDCAVFYDSLHHAENEYAALQSAYLALKSNGICVTSEAGRNHAKRPLTIEAVKRFGVTEKDMPPSLIVSIARQIGFSRVLVFPHLMEINRLVYESQGTIKNEYPFLIGIRNLCVGIRILAQLVYKKRNSGITVLIK
jgi:ubiquinone/menaquinone biosynthesis C-methylase UbiE